MITLKEVAKIAQVSTATVSYVLNNAPGQVSEETRGRVLKVIEETGYKRNHIAKSLRNNKTKTIGLIAEDINSDFTPGIICGVTEYAESKGYHVLLNDLHMMDKLYNRYENLSAYKKKVNENINYLLEFHVDGIIYIAMYDRTIENIIDQVSCPLIYTYSYSSNKGDYSVAYDNEQAAFNVFLRLHEKGHTRIGVIAGPRNSVPSNRRLLGIKRFCEENKLNFPPIVHGNWEYEPGYELASELLDHNPEITAVFALNDLMASGCIDACKGRGLSVPDDLSIIGFDNRKISAFLSPKLSTMGLPLKEMGVVSTKMLIDICKGQEIEVRQKLLECTYIERESTRDARV